MAGLYDTDFQAAMKTFYLGPLNDQVTRAHVLLNRLDKNSKDVAGNFAYVPLISARNPAVGSRQDSTSIGPLLPTAGRQTYTQATFTMGMHYGRGSVSGPSARKSRNNEGAFANALDTEMKGLMESLPDDLNRQVCGMGNGRAFSLYGTTAGTAQASSTLIQAEARDHFSVKVGDRVHYLDSTAGTGPLPTSGTTVANITLNAATNRHDVELTDITGDTVTKGVGAFYYGAIDSGTLTSESSSWATDILGIRALIDDGDIGDDEQDDTEAAEVLGDGNTTIGGITRSSNAFWQSKVYGNSGTKRAVTQNLLFQAHLTSTAINGASPSDIEMYGSIATWGTVGMIQVGGRIYNDTIDTVDMGFQFINVMGSKFFYDRDLHDGEIFFLDMRHIFILTQGGYEFWDADGNVIRIAAGGNRDAMEFTFLRDAQLGASNLRAHSVLKDLKDTMTVEGTAH
jgi:hypothetical protein